jgi:ATP-dependent exoDNAse (exonuclease V) beta subunit
MKSEILEKLKIFDNDPKFDFDPTYHKYTYDNKHFISVTQLMSRFHKPFETDYWSKEKADEAGVPQEFILNEWKQLNDHANMLGTATHNYIENFFNQIWQPLPTNLELISRINKFNIIYAKQLHRLEPLKFEQRVFSKKWKIAGMVDALFLHKGKIVLLDWKTNKDFTTDDYCYPEKLLEPFDDYKKNHLNEYSIQLALYSLILKEYGFNIGNGYLLHIGPNDEAKLYKTHDFRPILEKYLNDNFL